MLFGPLTFFIFSIFFITLFMGSRPVSLVMPRRERGTARLVWRITLVLRPFITSIQRATSSAFGAVAERPKIWV